ncbi:hypothetical protein M0805_002471 [Coniferiporia weirii]|nr:hypothetical protein M0805_002471 [Coniferiporia weirii]
MKPSKKRPRVTESHDNPNGQGSRTQNGVSAAADPTDIGPAGIKHDKDYYFTDGSCIIRVEDMLFNIHRTIISRGSPSFSMLLTLPQGGQNPEGTTDENPIVLQGEAVKKFRHFLWALYAMPHEIQDFPRVRSTLPKLLDIVNLAVKYSFKSLEVWACGVLKMFIAQQPFPLRESKPVELVQIMEIIRLARLCHHKELLEALIDSFQGLAMTSPGYNKIGLLLADQLEPPVPMLMGAVYYSAMLHGPEFWDTPEMRAAPYRRLRILNGYYRLTSLWERLRKNPPEYSSEAAICKFYGHCAETWKIAWREQVVSKDVMDLNLADVIGRLKVIVASFDNPLYRMVSYKVLTCRSRVVLTFLQES